MTTRPSLVPWTLANAVGMALGFLTFIQTLMFLTFGLDFRLHWSAGVVESLDAQHPEAMERLLRIGLVIGLPLGMVVFMLAYLLLDAVVLPGSESSISWAGEIALIGFFVGGTAGAVSGRALLSRIAPPPASTEARTPLPIGEVHS